MPVKKSFSSRAAAFWPFTRGTVPWTVLAVAAYVFLAPNVDFAPDLQWHDGQRLAQLVLLVVIVVTLLLPGTAREMTSVWSDFHPGIRLALMSAFLLGLVSSVLAPLPRWALLEWGLLWLLLILLLSVAAQRRRSGDRLDQWLVMLFFATAAAYALSSCTVYLAMLQIGPFFNVRELFVSFSNVRFFGPIQTMLLPFLLLPAMWWGTTWVRRILLWSVPAVWWMLAIASGTRGTWIALLIGMVVVAIFGGGVRCRWLKWQLWGFLCGFLCYGIFIWALPQYLEQPAWFIHRAEDIVSLSHREVLWGNSINFAIQHPWFGIGPMQYAYFESVVAAHPHSAVLQWAAEWGIPAALLFTGICATAGLTFAGHVRRVVDTHDADKGLVLVALLAALTGAAAQAMVDGVLVMPVSQIFLALLCGWAIGIYLSKRERAHSFIAFQMVLAFVITGVAAGVVTCGVMPEISRLAEREREYLTAHPQHDLSLPRLYPRFWTQGWINK